nr:putative reverse transcriptase domain-containing protein [Tanacetum cinerariifolium]
MEFKVRDKVMLKISPWKGVVRFSKRGKLKPRYVGPFKVLAKVRKVAYRLELLQELSRVHHTFHVSNHKKCYDDEPLVMPLEGIHVDDRLQFVDYPIEIMEREIKRLKRSRIPLVKIPICYDDDEDCTIATTPKEPDNSLSMGDEHLDTIPTTKSDEFIKSSVENLVPNPSESEGEYECDVPAYEDFTTFSNILFDADYDFSFVDDQSFYDEVIPKEIYSNPLFDEEIISMKIDPHHFNVEYNLIESLLNHDSPIISSSSKIDSLFDEFASELLFLKPIPPRIYENDCDPEEETSLIKRLLYDNSSPHPLEEFISKNSDTAFESFYPCPIPIEDSDSLMKEINLSFTSDDPMLPDIEEDDYDSKRDILILEELLGNDSLSLFENESFHFEIPSSSRPPAKPLDGNSGILNVEVMGDISELNVPLPRLMLTLVLNQEKFPGLLSY